MMTQFNVDSLDFEDDEEVRFGSNTDYATRFDSANSRLELADVTNGTTGFVPQDVGTDLVGGKYAQTVAEGKALADDGNVYDSIQMAVDNASSYVKIGPGEFRESVTIDTAGLTVQGSGERTFVNPSSGVGFIVPNGVPNVIIRSMKVGTGDGDFDSGLQFDGAGCSVIDVTIISPSFHGIHLREVECVAVNCEVSDTTARGIRLEADRQICTNCTFTNCGQSSILLSRDEQIVSNNICKNNPFEGIRVDGADTITIGNMIIDSNGSGINIQSGTDTIIANNRLVNTGGISDGGTGTVLDANLTT